MASRRDIYRGEGKVELFVPGNKNATYPKAVDDLKADHILSESFELRPVKYLNQQVEQDHRFIKRLVNPGMGYVDFNEREANFEGVRNNEYDPFGKNFGS